MRHNCYWLILLVLSLHSAAADTVTISGTGTVTLSTLPGTAINDPITVSVSYDATAVATSSSQTMARFGVGTDLAVAIQVGGNDWMAALAPGAVGDSGFEPIQVQNDDTMLSVFGAQGDGDAISFVALPTLVGNVLSIAPWTVPNDGGLFVLSLNDISNPFDLVSNLSLPDAGNVPGFNQMTLADGVFRIGGVAPFEVRYELDPGSMSLVVPEPSALTLLLLAGLAFGCGTCRRSVP